MQRQVHINCIQRQSSREADRGREAEWQRGREWQRSRETRVAER